MKNFQKIPLLSSLLSMFLCPMHMVHSQTVINAGEINGTWTKDQSPYLIKGDVNIPAGDSLVIMPGVKVTFGGLYRINVQGYLKAAGNKNDSIFFTIADTSIYRKKDFTGWGGIRFDRRSVTWDTLVTKMPKNDEARKIYRQRVENGNLDTMPRIILKLQPEDLVHDTIVSDSLFHAVKGSKIEYCRFEYASAINNRKPYVFGGAIYIYRYSNLIISNCKFSNNRAYAGGAIYCKEAAPVINNNLFHSNRAESSGGAMVFIHSGAFISGNTAKSNTSGHNGGAVLFYESSPYLLNNTFFNNSAENSGGAIYCENELKQFFATGEYRLAKNSKYLREQFTERIAVNSLVNSNKGNSLGKIINNVICNNKASYGGALGLSSTAPDLVNNTISNNRAGEGSGIYSYFSSPSVTNSIIYGNSGSKNNEQVYLYGNTPIYLNYCNIESGKSGIAADTAFHPVINYSDNIAINPIYKNADSYDYSLGEKSGCIDAGTPNTSEISILLSDIRGNIRIFNNQIDIGAMEYIPAVQVKKKSTDEKLQDMDILKESIVLVYPNPTNGLFNITLHNNKYKTIGISIYAQNGQSVLHKEYPAGEWLEQQVDISGKSPGIYIICIDSGSNIIYRGEIVLQ
ncbi:MAG: T9SS type A sorting domain-containing protein [Bacteroidales bacterium]|nr:T9SS type A sorting domain-containing protein [Bacteroidales bacterium]